MWPTCCGFSRGAGAARRPPGRRAICPGAASRFFVGSGPIHALARIGRRMGHAAREGGESFPPLHRGNRPCQFAPIPPSRGGSGRGTGSIRARSLAGVACRQSAERRLQMAIPCLWRISGPAWNGGVLTGACPATRSRKRSFRLNVGDLGMHPRSVIGLQHRQIGLFTIPDKQKPACNLK